MKVKSTVRFVFLPDDYKEVQLMEGGGLKRFARITRIFMVFLIIFH